MSRAARTLRATRAAAHVSRDSAPAPLRRERVLLALEALPETERLVLALDLCDGLDAREIAEVLELSPRTVTRTRNRALTGMRRALAGAAVPTTPSNIIPIRSAM